MQAGIDRQYQPTQQVLQARGQTRRIDEFDEVMFDETAAVSRLAGQLAPADFQRGERTDPSLELDERPQRTAGKCSTARRGRYATSKPPKATNSMNPRYKITSRSAPKR